MPFTPQHHNSDGLVVPLDVAGAIIDILGECKEHGALAACALVCHAFLPRCREHIFRSMTISKFRRKSNINAATFSRLLSTTPEIGTYIQTLIFSIHSGDLAIPSLPDALMMITRLESLKIKAQVDGIYDDFEPRLDWFAIPPPVRKAFEHLFGLPTFSKFHLDGGLYNFNFSELSVCSHLKSLTLVGLIDVPEVLSTDVHPLQLETIDCTSKTEGSALALLKANLSDGRPCIDLTTLKEIHLTCNHRSRPSHLLGYLSEQGGTINLVDIRISVFSWSPQRLFGSLIPIPMFSTLKHLFLQIELNPSYLKSDPYIGLCAELGMICGANVLEEISICVLFLGGPTRARGKEWDLLDEVLSRPGWSSLRRVKFTILLNQLPGAISDGELYFNPVDVGRHFFSRVKSNEAIDFIFAYADYEFDFW